MAIHPTARDKKLFEIIDAEKLRQNTTLQLIASENFASKAVLEAAGSVLTNKYAEGYPSKRYYGGNFHIDESESLCIERAKDLFGAEHANVQPHSGANANMAAYLAILKPGDTVLGMSLDHGGHLTHGSPVNASGILYNFVGYGVTPSDERLDYEVIANLAKKHQPKLIVAGSTAHSRIIQSEPLRKIADEVGAYFMFDAAHVAGLIVGGVYPNPVPYADIVTFTNHKTMRGPRGGTILCKKELAEAIDKAIFPGLQGGPLEHIIAAKAVSFFEANTEEFKDYANQVVKNAEGLAEALGKEGFRLVSGGTETHLMVMDLRPFDEDLSGKEAQIVFEKAGITTNKNTIPDDPRSPFVTSGIRLGTPAVTTQGMKQEHMPIIAGLMSKALKHRDDETIINEVKQSVAELCSDFTPYPD